MPRNLRCVESGQIYHVTQRGVDRQKVFFSDGDRHTYLRLTVENAVDCQVRILAWCLMSNHVHWIVEAGKANSLAVFFRRIHGRYAQYLNARRGRSGHLWQNRYYSCALGPSHLWLALSYVEANPVRAGIVRDSQDYRWSSAAAHAVGPEGKMDTEAAILIDWEFWRRAGGIQGWRETVGGLQDVRQVAKIRECTHSGKPYGDESFLKAQELRFQRQWLPVGRPAKRSISGELAKREMGTERSASPHVLEIRTGSG